VLEYWSVGVLECWSWDGEAHGRASGLMEDWSDVERSPALAESRFFGEIPPLRESELPHGFCLGSIEGRGKMGEGRG